MISLSWEVVVVVVVIVFMKGLELQNKQDIFLDGSSSIKRKEKKIIIKKGKKITKKKKKKKKNGCHKFCPLLLAAIQWTIGRDKLPISLL